MSASIAMSPAGVETAQHTFPHSKRGSAHNPSALTPTSIHCVRIGGVSLSLSVGGSNDILLDRGLEAFSAQDSSSNIQLEVRWQHTLPVRRQPIFDSQALWALSRENENFVFTFTSPLLGSEPYKCLRIDESFRAGEMVLSE